MANVKLQLVANHGTSQSAWNKAPADVATIAEKLGFVRVADGCFQLGQFSFARRVVRKLRFEHWLNRLCWKLEIEALRKRFAVGGELLLQHPLPGSWTFDLTNIDDIGSLKRKGVKITVLVHDVGALRGSSNEVGGSGDLSWEKRLFGVADKLIVHNGRMRDFVVNMGVQGKVVPLGVFDYLVAPDIGLIRRQINGRNSVLLVGGFGPVFSKYVRELKTISGIQWVLYGHMYDEALMGAANVQFRGKFDSDRPPLDCDCSFGLVWNGESIKTCSGVIGEYSRFCNNHKMSLYFAMGLPVIVWKEAAVAEFVEENHVGLVVDSLMDVHIVLNKITEEEYKVLRENVARLSEELRAGAFTQKALSQD